MLSLAVEHLFSSHIPPAACTCYPSTMNTLSLWLLFLLLLSGLPMAWRGPNCVFLGHSALGTSAPNPSLLPSSNASQGITELVAENIDTKGDFGESDLYLFLNILLIICIFALDIPLVPLTGDFGESDFIPVIKIFY